MHKKSKTVQKYFLVASVAFLLCSLVWLSYVQVKIHNFKSSTSYCIKSPRYDQYTENLCAVALRIEPNHPELAAAILDMRTRLKNPGYNQELYVYLKFHPDQIAQHRTACQKGNFSRNFCGYMSQKIRESVDTIPEIQLDVYRVEYEFFDRDRMCTIKHTYLVHRKTGQIIDPTGDQFYHQVPYAQGWQIPVDSLVDNQR